MAMVEVRVGGPTRVARVSFQTENNAGVRRRRISKKRACCTTNKTK